MQLRHLVFCFSFALGSVFYELVAATGERDVAIRRDGSTSAFPTLVSGSASALPSSSAASKSTPPPSTSAPTSAATGLPSSSASSASRSVIPTPSANITATVSDAIASITSSVLPIPSSNSTSNSTSATGGVEALPLKPRITPALSIGGVLLILTGIAYALVGVKNKWVHVFLSTAYLTSLAVLVLIVYVINPPVSNAIQGAYFVAIFFSGAIFGGGALIFKEVTEGLGCLLGGFCLSMWFLTTKTGGLITNPAGKGIFIAVFCVVCWSLSFSHYTRAYGLIGSTSFSGATAFVLGIDCFSKGGLKEFWIYVWGLNDNLFPLNQQTYPITRGTRVETIVIVLGAIIGIISQIKLWRIVQNRQKQRAATQAEHERRRDAVEEAIGRHLERQNDRDRTEWEKRYGNRLEGKRNTILWTEAHTENKRFSSTSTTEIGSSQNSESNESLEMTTMQAPASKTSLHNSKSKRHSNNPVHPIQEVDEEEAKLNSRSMTKEIANHAEDASGRGWSKPDSGKYGDAETPSSYFKTETQHEDEQLKEAEAQVAHSLSLRPHTSKPTSKKTALRLQFGEETATKKRSLTSLKDLKRRSFQSLAPKSPNDSPRSPNTSALSDSKEALVVDAPCLSSHSRASSVAATLDEENENLNMPAIESYADANKQFPPRIVVLPVHATNFEKQLNAGLQGPPSPSGLSDQFDADPEELVRPVSRHVRLLSEYPGQSPGRLTNGKGDGFLDDDQNSTAGMNPASNNDGLTKDALDQVPSQMSDVVLSYRTNEWAKHIATAEAPIVEEPDAMANDDAEPSTQLADPVSPSVPEPQQQPESAAKPLPLPLPSPVRPVTPSEAGIKVNPDIQQEQSRSRPTSEALGPSMIAGATVESIQVPSRSFSQSSSQQKQSGTDPAHGDAQPPPVSQALSSLKSARRTSNPVQKAPSILRSTPIHENVATEFAPPSNTWHRNSIGTSARHSQQSHYTPNPSQIDLTQRPSSALPYNHQPGFQRTFSYNQSQTDVRPSTAYPISPYSNPSLALRSDTRLQDHGTKSHQPLKRNNTNDSNRETLMANWRMQLAQSHATKVVPVSQVDNRYTQQMLDYEADKIRREQEKHNKARREAAMDQSMRTRGMIDAHKEVLKRMQNQANKKLH